MAVMRETMFTFDPAALTALAKRHREAYAGGDPFPHIVFDDFLPEGVLDPVLEEFPDPTKIDWVTFDRATERKLITKDENQIGPYTRYLIAQLNSSTFIRFLQDLTGIQGLAPDPHLLGGGLHRIEPGGFLKIHADFNQHPELRLDRRINLLLYLNKDWPDAYGGHLELWDTVMTRCAKRVLPVFNRCVLFSTTSTAYHGNPEPLTCPKGNSRKSLALYYYTNGRPEEEQRDSHSTLFKIRPGEKLTVTSKQLLRGLTPPLLFEAMARLRRRLRSSAEGD